MLRYPMAPGLVAFAALGGCFELPPARLPEEAAALPAEVDVADVRDDAPDDPTCAHGTCASLGQCVPEGGPHLLEDCRVCHEGDFLPCPFGCDEGRCVQPVGVAAGGRQSCAWTAAGDLFCWGWQGQRQLANGVAVGAPARPVRVRGLPPMDLLVSGDEHVCGRVPDGRAVCWGANRFYQLGEVSTATLPVVAAVPAPSVLAAGVTDTTCAITALGAARCWGMSLDGTWWNEGNAKTAHGVEHTWAAPFEDVSVGNRHACALADGGRDVVCWGHATWGQLGEGVEGGPAPVRVVRLEDPAVAVASGQGHSCVALAQGTRVACWGHNHRGQLGRDPALVASSGTPHELDFTFEPPVVALSAGGDHTCALQSGGALRCWGDNGSGQLGSLTVGRSSTPLTVTGLPPVSALSAGASHTCVVTRAGGVRCWGGNTFGQLGDGDEGGTIHPQQVEVRWNGD